MTGEPVHVARDARVANEHLALMEGRCRGLLESAPDAMVVVNPAGEIVELTPDLVKLDMGLIRGINADPARQALVAGMGYFATRRKIRLVAEGIETLAELETLRSLAIRYGQGYLLGRPQDGRGRGPWPTSIAVPAS